MPDLTKETVFEAYKQEWTTFLQDEGLNEVKIEAKFYTPRAGMNHPTDMPRQGWTGQIIALYITAHFDPSAQNGNGLKEKLKVSLLRKRFEDVEVELTGADTLNITASFGTTTQSAKA